MRCGAQGEQGWGWVLLASYSTSSVAFDWTLVMLTSGDLGLPGEHYSVCCACPSPTMLPAPLQPPLPNWSPAGMGAWEIPEELHGCRKAAAPRDEQLPLLCQDMLLAVSTSGTITHPGGVYPSASSCPEQGRSSHWTEPTAPAKKSRVHRGHTNRAGDEGAIVPGAGGAGGAGEATWVLGHVQPGKAQGERRHSPALGRRCLDLPGTGWTSEATYEPEGDEES